ncbi:outer membrane protein assembly factor BamB family protein [Parapedobacter tibetensis]|uniref:outer membrane protein assembly factor BamB family protein n=1 Tax=Parapedobacter tibetensis TaxID=2972951 RepID=UPI00214D3CAB|nr:PQQ-binding-like beta-propeller repeat protein [Parapedobacter tibetensis]
MHIHLQSTLSLVFFYISTAVCLGQSTPPGSVSFAVLSDSHIGKPGNDTSLELVVDAINQNSEISFVIHAGDASDFGSHSQLKEAKRILDKLDKPYMIVPGNHDTYWSDNAGASFTELFGGQKFIKDINGIRFIGISTGPYARATIKGYVPKGQLDWLEKTMASTPLHQPIILIAHIPLLDTYISNYQEVLSVLKDHNVLMVFSGHGHSNKIINEAGFKSLMTTTTQFRNGLTTYNQITIANDSLTAKAIFPEAGKDTVWTTLALMNKADIQAELSKLNVSEAETDRPESVKITWSYMDNGNIISTPIASRKNILFGNMLGEFKSVSTQNSKINWTYKTEGAIYSSPAISGNKVVFASVDSTIYCLDVLTGAKLWELKTDAPIIASPIIEEDMVFIGGSDNKFRAIELNSGEISWIFHDMEGAVFMKPSIAGKTIVFGTWHNKLYALDKNDGSLSWFWENPDRSPYYSPAICVPVIMDTVVYVVTPEGLLRGFDLATGDLVSEIEEQGLWESLGGDIKKKRLLAKTNQSAVVGWKIDSGSPRKFLEINLGTASDLSPSIPIIHKNSGFFGSNSGAVYSIDLSKKKINWSFDMSDNMVNTLSRFSKGILLASSVDGRIVLFEEE